MIRRLKKHMLWTLCAATGTLAACSADVRDALISGAFDFVSGSTTDILRSLLPVVDMVAGG